jgi:hypothetical protein
VNITANTGWAAGQLSDFAVYPSAGGSSSATLAAAPTSLNFAGQAVGSTSSAQAVTVTNTGSATASISSVTTSGDFAQTNTCGSALAANASCTVNVTFSPTASGTRTGSVTVNGNASNNPLTIALTGTGTSGAPTNLALNKATSESSNTQNYVSSNVTDGDSSSYWESANGTFPQWVQVDLGSSQSVSRVVLELPDSTSWGARNQTLSLLGSTDGSNFTTVVGSATYTFDPNVNGNTVTITFPASTQRYWRVDITANSGWPAGQLSEFQIFNS